MPIKIIWSFNYRVEDHDDLTPIFNRQSDMLTMTYGDFFLAELIEAQDDNMQCLVAEVYCKEFQLKPLNLFIEMSDVTLSL